jgi:phosphate transport system substrate-binding protein
MSRAPRRAAGRHSMKLLYRGAAAAVAVAAVVAGFLGTGEPAGASTALAPVSGEGSTYAALAFQTWIAGAQVNAGLNINYTPTGSPAGLSTYGAGTVTFAGTEADYTELYVGTPSPTQHVPRGYAYTPDVAGAIALMYHVALNPTGQDPVTYLHLTPLTIARIFMRYITWWTSATITEDNKGLVLPHEPITLNYRSAPSGTTALFYTWIHHEDPTQYETWAQNYQFPTTTRVWTLAESQRFVTGSGFSGFGTSDEQAQRIASATGLWSIGYDEFGYASIYHDSVAWVQNASGNYTQPYAKNIAAALTKAVLAKTTSQTLAGVYTNPTPTTYPMSAYSYILYQCATTSTRPTCKGSYANQGVLNTMAKFMRYVACTGQINMAQVGYSPLPKELSQYLANAIGYMSGQAPATLTPTNCSNPQENGNLGVGATPPPDPTKDVTSEGPGPKGTSSSSTSSTGSNAGAGTGTTGGTSGTTGGTAGTSSTTGGTTGTTGNTGGTGSNTTATTTVGGGVATAVGTKGAVLQAVGGGSTAYRTSDPVPYTLTAAATAATPPGPLLLLLLLLLLPVAWLSVVYHRRRRSSS